MGRPLNHVNKQQSQTSKLNFIKIVNYWTRNRFFLYFSIKIDIFKTFHDSVCAVSYVAVGQDICVPSQCPGLSWPMRTHATAPTPLLYKLQYFSWNYDYIVTMSC